MQQVTHAIWFSVLMVVVLITSSMVSSAPLMAITMAKMQPTKQVSSSGMHKMSPCQEGNLATLHHADSSEIVEASSVVNCIDMAMDGVHSCCSAMCAAAFALFSLGGTPFVPHVDLLLIHSEPFTSSITISRSLYRPPIA
ncbi:hypothetical protein MEG05_17680 [Vibrio aestuarianus]|uniref:hypothetical protein n=1 Tax=Vibrio aestuarianus TaxID=28171 RepID=UPI00237CC194|nr:hypothetical protein [Vibrio aestuarianus]MDE1315847.1 hypothetical protein [Vibrio aestuarianus]